MVSLVGDGSTEASATLRAIAASVHSCGMVNARAMASYHLTLGRLDKLPDPRGAFTYPPEGAAPQPLPAILGEQLRLASWALVVAKLRHGQTPATDNETEEI